MFAEAFGIILLILLIVITWRVVDSIMQAPGTSAALPVVSAPPSKVVAGTPSQTNFTMPDMSSYYGSYFPTGTTSTTSTVVPAGPPVTTAAVPGATATPSALPPVVITPPSPADLQASMGLSGLSMPSVDMSKYYPTSLAGTPAPVVPAPAPAATPVVAPPVVSAPAPVVAPPVVSAPAPVVVAPPVVAPAPQSVVGPITFTFLDTILGTNRTGEEGVITKLTGIPPNTCRAGFKFNGANCDGGAYNGIITKMPADCPTGYTSAWNDAANKSLCYPSCPSGTKQVKVGECRSCPAGTEDTGFNCSSLCPAGKINSPQGDCIPPNTVRFASATPICPTGFKAISDHGMQMCMDAKYNIAKNGVTCPAGSGLITNPNMQACITCPAGMTKLSKDGYCMA